MGFVFAQLWGSLSPTEGALLYDDQGEVLGSCLSVVWKEHHLGLSGSRCLPTWCGDALAQETSR